MAGYRTATEVLLKTNITSALAVCASSLFAAETLRKKIEKGFHGWNKALLGAVSIFTSSLLIKELVSIAKASDDLLDIQNQLENKGLSVEQVQRLTAGFYNEVAKKVPTASVAEYLRTVGELRAITGAGEEGLLKAAALAPKAMMVNTLIKNTMGHRGSGQNSEYWKILRSEELKGVATNDAEREKMTDDIFSYVMAFAGKLTTSDFLQMAKEAGTAWTHLDREKALGPVAILAAELGSGEKAGRALKTLEQVQVGAGMKLSTQQLHILKDAGLINSSDVMQGAQAPLRAADGGELNDAHSVKLHGIKGSIEYLGDIPGWIREVIAPAIHNLAKRKKAGGELGTEEQIYDTLMTKLFRFQNAQRLAILFSDQGMLDQATKDFGLANIMKKAEEGYKNFSGDSPVGVEEGYETAKNNMWAAIGAPFMKMAIPMMQGMTHVFQVIGEFANTHPTAIKDIAIGFTILAGAFAAAGVVLLLAAIGSTGWVVGIVIALGAIFAAAAPEAWHAFLAALNDLLHLNATAFIKDYSKLSDILIAGITNAVAELFKVINVNISFVSATYKSMLGAFLNHYFGNALKLLPKFGGSGEHNGGGGLEWESWHPGRDHTEPIQINHVTAMSDGSVLARNTQLYYASYTSTQDQQPQLTPASYSGGGDLEQWHAPSLAGGPDRSTPGFAGGPRDKHSTHPSNKSPYRDDGAPHAEPRYNPEISKAPSGPRISRAEHAPDIRWPEKVLQSRRDQQISRPSREGGQGGPIDRSRFVQELKEKPGLREKVMAISAGENLHPSANKAVFESMMNRAAVKGTTLEHEARWTSEGGYYDDKPTAGSGHASQMSAMQNPRSRQLMERNLDSALAGSNVSNYATENASGAWGRRRMAGADSGALFQKSYAAGGELFGYPVRRGAAGYGHYSTWRNAQGGDSAAIDRRHSGDTSAIGGDTLASSPGGRTGSINAVSAEQSRTPYGMLHGKLNVGGNVYDWSSGGRGRGSLPYGEYKVGGPEKHSALHGTAYPLSDARDPTLGGAVRSGLFIHSGRGQASHGCIHIPLNQYAAFKRDMATHKPATVTVSPSTPTTPNNEKVADR
jgi:hypothetical protein